MDYINLIEREAELRSDDTLAEDYKAAVSVLTKTYGEPDQKQPSVYQPDRQPPSAIKEAEIVFKFEDGGAIKVMEFVGWHPAVIIHYEPGVPREHY